MYSGVLDYSSVFLNFEFVFSLYLFCLLAIECIITVPADPAVPQIITDGLGPCKYATQAEQGTITIRFAAANQAAFIAITANSQRNTRVKLTCTNIAGTNLFTVSHPCDVKTEKFLKTIINKIYHFC